MELAEASSFCKTFKGAAISCLILMWAVRHSRRNFSRDDLARLTGWSRETVADGLNQLELQGLVFRVSRYQWQLTDLGFQLSFDQRGVEKIDSGESIKSTPVVVVFKESIYNESLSLKEPLLPSGVDKIDSDPFRDSMLEGLVDQLIRCGSAPLTAREAIQQSLEAGRDPKEIELRILWWRVYCLAHKSIHHPGNLIAARVAAGIDTPEDFGIFDIPDRYHELAQELEKLRAELEPADKNDNGWVH